MKCDTLICKVDDSVDTFAIDALTFSQLDLPSLSYLQTYRVEIPGCAWHGKFAEPTSGERNGNVLLVATALAKKFGIRDRVQAKLSISNSDAISRVQYTLLKEGKPTKPILEGVEAYTGDVCSLEGNTVKIISCDPGTGYITNQTLLEDKNPTNGGSKPKVRRFGHQNTRKNAVGFDRLTGKDDVIGKIRCNIILPFQNPELATKHLGRPLNGALICGADGVGKTVVVKATAEEADAAILKIPAKAATDPEVIRAIYKEASTKKHRCIVLVDPFDNIISRVDTRNTALATLQECMDNSRQNEQVITMVVGQSLDQLPKSLLRAGRLEQVIQLGLPNRQQRAELFRYFLRCVNAGQEIDCKLLADHTETYTGADIQSLIREVGMQGMIASRTGGDGKIVTEDILDMIKARGFP